MENKNGEIGGLKYTYRLEDDGWIKIHMPRAQPGFMFKIKALAKNCEISVFREMAQFVIDETKEDAKD